MCYDITVYNGLIQSRGVDQDDYVMRSHLGVAFKDQSPIGSQVTIAISHGILAGFSPAVNQLFRGGVLGRKRGIPHAKFLARGA